MATTAAAITPVDSQPIAQSGRGTTNDPMTRLCRAITMITAISGTATMPFSTADQNRALIGSNSGEVDADADEDCGRDRAVERPGVPRERTETRRPAERLGERVGGGAGQHRARLAYLGRLGRVERGKWLISFDRTLEGLHYIGDGGTI
jgi:hypothetical protein